MYCIKCWHKDTKVLDSRINETGSSIRRRRECLFCWYRFSTYEEYRETRLEVEKSTWYRENYDKEKLFQSIFRTYNNPQEYLKEIEYIVSKVEKEILSKPYIRSHDIGIFVLKILKTHNEIAFLRYASVFYDFMKYTDFINYIHKEFPLEL